MKLLGVYGYARSGKNSIGDHLISGYNFEDGAFADPLKEAAAIAFDVPLYYFYDEEFKEVKLDFWGISPRRIAQIFGTECLRNGHREDHWIKRLESTYLKFKEGSIPGFVVTDMRFENEIDWVRNEGGVLIKVTRPGIKGAVESHVSEQHFCDNMFDYVIENDGTLKELYNKVDLIMSDL